MAKVKICGITNLKDALAAVNAGCDALGFVFYKKSPRYISPGQARDIIGQMPRRVIKIGVFVNSPEDAVKKIAGFCKLDMLQFHGQESPEFCGRFRRYKIIKAFRVKDKPLGQGVLKYNPFAFLFDTFASSQAGGTGKKFNWDLIRHIDGLNRPVFLSGGLTADNVEEAISITHPEWVDVSSGIEILPGKKDRNKMRKFIKIAKRCK